MDNETFGGVDAAQFELDMLTFMFLSDKGKMYTYEDAVEAAKKEIKENRKLDKEFLECNT
jgi:hypothetical protein